MNSLKVKLIEALGNFGFWLYLFLGLFLTAFPVLMIGTMFELPFLVKILIYGLIFFLKDLIPFSDIIVWSVGLIGAIGGAQDFFAYAYYILYGIMFFASFIPGVIRFIAAFFSDKD